MSSDRDSDSMLATKLCKDKFCRHPICRQAPGENVAAHLSPFYFLMLRELLCLGLKNVYSITNQYQSDIYNWAIFCLRFLHLCYHSRSRISLGINIAGQVSPVRSQINTLYMKPFYLQLQCDMYTSREN